MLGGMIRTGWQQVTSSNIDAVAYHDAGGVGCLQVRFRATPGRRAVVYEYRKRVPGGTPQREYGAMYLAPSCGKWLHRNIKLNASMYDVQGPFSC